MMKLMLPGVLLFHFGDSRFYAHKEMQTVFGLRRNVLRGFFWLAVYGLLSIAPLLIITSLSTREERGFWTELSVALGFIGFTMICLQFLITARFNRFTAPYGIDIILDFHRHISIVAVSFIVAHPVILFIENPDLLSLLDPRTAPPRAILGSASLVALLLIVCSSLFRKKLKLKYEWWKSLHGILALFAMLAALFHMLGVRHYLAGDGARLFIWMMTGAALYALLFIRVVKPLLLSRRYYLVKDVTPERGKCWTITFAPFGHEGMRFNPGQFAWLTLGNTPFAMEEHPFSFSSSARRTGELSLTIKELGDYTSQIGKTERGMRAYIDGPHGAFTYKRRTQAKHMVFIAGGVGITPIISMLRTLSDEDYKGNIVLFYSNTEWKDVAFREALEELRNSLNLNVIHVLESPGEEWSGESGYLDEKVLKKYLPDNLDEIDFYICGPLPLMDSVEKILREELDVSPEKIEMEKFNLV